MPSLVKLNHYLPAASDALDAYADLLEELGTDIRTLPRDETDWVSEEALIHEGDRLASCIRALAEASGRTPAQVLDDSS